MTQTDRVARPDVQQRPLSYSMKLDHRDPAQIQLLVIHCTELPDLSLAREYGERIHYEGSGTGNSGHFYIDRNGALEQWVPLDRVAHHVRDFNETSIGVELVNRGRYPDWFDSRRQDSFEPYPPEQVATLIALIQWLEVELPALQAIAAHESLDRDRVPASDDENLLVARKRDPGPTFPWAYLLDHINLTRFSNEDGCGNQEPPK